MHLNTILLLIPAILSSGVTSAPVAHEDGHQHGAHAATPAGAAPIARDEGAAKRPITDTTWWYGYAQKREADEKKQQAKRAETDKAWWYVYEGKREAAQRGVEGEAEGKAKRGATDKAWWYVYEGKRDAGGKE